MHEKLLEKLDNIAAAVHELAYAQAATAAMVARTAGIKASPEDFLPGNPSSGRFDDLRELAEVPREPETRPEQRR